MHNGYYTAFLRADPSSNLGKVILLNKFILMKRIIFYHLRKWINRISVIVDCPKIPKMTNFRAHTLFNIGEF
jgi:hypothetical protein